MASPMSTWMNQVRKRVKANDLDAFRMVIIFTINASWNKEL